ncbi:MAG: tRNA (adenosine(37)-N6)-threonylcarbamoyltransferase complex ATPase subunit type 1 TsaE [Azospira oryzae]|nr:MAG: tRNA (adenosine(37)-N6)-threonylcarbamoyltransferase complex ATPase subunit type 1 TsaE [Azospira oryzae]PZP79608.1 MAG: tRNA (adenosine(37)-N6)-threonylcarbamoyltransferase complex ATPase subunit type 1 TsaE [Azospira oryzae]
MGDANALKSELAAPTLDGLNERGAFKPRTTKGIALHTCHDNEARPAFSCFLPDEPATLSLGAALAECIAPGLRLYLGGDLGAGKTTLVRGLLRGLGYRGKVKSPTFTLVELYAISSLDLYHFDFYRFDDPAEWEHAGFREYFNPRSVCVVEWPDKAAGFLPPPDLDLRLVFHGSGRIVHAVGNTDRGHPCIQRLKAHYKD